MFFYLNSDKNIFVDEAIKTNGRIIALFLFQYSLTIPVMIFVNPTIVSGISSIILVSYSLYRNIKSIINNNSIFLLMFIFFATFVNSIINGTDPFSILPFYFYFLPIFFIFLFNFDFFEFLRFGFVLAIINFFVICWTPFFGGTNYMRFGYGMLVSVVFLYEIISSYKKTILKKKWIFLSYILFAISLIEMIIYGARGALVSFVLLFAIDRFIIHRKFIFFNIISVGLFFLIYSNILNILTWFQKIINIFGGRAYAIDKIRLQIAQGFAEASSGRDDVYMRSIDCIKENFLFGRGIDLLGDGAYVHNIFLQVFQDLGFFAFLVLIIFLFSILIYFFKNDANEEKNILAIFFSISIGRLLFSSILWKRPEFWMLAFFYFSLFYSCRRNMFYLYKKTYSTKD